ncbi:MAG: tetratricopeptide repeat protein [Coriobacteriia bacterium]|nr:tetratricopeptide repeat protein [Coriobacteriia bacterium]
MSGRSRLSKLADDLSREGRVASAVDACYQALLLDESDPVVHALLADLFLEGDFYDEAIRSASRAIELDPDCAPAYLALGLAYDRRGGMWDQSILVWHELAEVVPDLVTAHVQLGEAFAAGAFEGEAIESWRRALELDPSEPRAMYNLAIAALKREGVATALPGFRKAGELDPSQDDFFFALAGVYDDGSPAPHPDEVEADRDARLAAAFALAFEEDYFGAADLIRLILNDDPADPEALALAGYLYLKQEAVNEAMSVALRCLALSTKTPTGVYVLGAAFHKRPGLNRNATRVFEALARAVPNEPMPHVLLAESLLGLQRYSDAKQAYLRAVELDPACVRARFGLAAALLTEGEHATAAWEVRRAAYHDTRRQGLFRRLFDSYVEGRADDADA